MVVSEYTPSGILHETSVDFSRRSIAQPVHLVQYDDSLPVLAVTLHNNGQLYHLPINAEANIRFGKKDRTFVYDSALGCNDDRTVLYFKVTKQMTIESGDHRPVIEIIINSGVACSSNICIAIDKNPMQLDDIKSSNEFKSLEEYRDEAKDYSEKAKAAADEVMNIKENVLNLSEEVEEYRDETKDYSNKASIYRNESEEFSNLSKSYAIGTDDQIRPGDSTDNSKYYCNAAKTAKEECREYKDSIASNIDNINKMMHNVTFAIDFETGELMQGADATFSFSLNEENGNLEYEEVS